MNYEESDERKKSRSSFRTIMDIGMGLFYVAIGGVLVFLKKFGLMEVPAWVAYSLGTIMMVGGAFRFYKGLIAVLPQKKAPGGDNN
jgi:hypothetical protein